MENVNAVYHCLSDPAYRIFREWGESHHRTERLSGFCWTYRWQSSDDSSSSISSAVEFSIPDLEHEADSVGYRKKVTQHIQPKLRCLVSIFRLGRAFKPILLFKAVLECRLVPLFRHILSLSASLNQIARDLIPKWHCVRAHAPVFDVKILAGV